MSAAGLMRAYDLRQFFARPVPYATTHGLAAAMAAGRLLQPGAVGPVPVFAAPPLLPLAANTRPPSQPFDYRRGESASPSSQGTPTGTPKKGSSQAGSSPAHHYSHQSIMSMSPLGPIPLLMMTNKPLNTDDGKRDKKVLVGC